MHFGRSRADVVEPALEAGADRRRVVGVLNRDPKGPGVYAGTPPVHGSFSTYVRSNVELPLGTITTGIGAE